MWFNDNKSQTYRVKAGVPQGSPLSPLLFCLFMAPLYDKLRAIKGIAVVGFADDTNTVACGSSTKDCVEALQESWAVCAEFARERGMQFEPAKSVLIHFCRTREPRTESIVLNGTRVDPVEEAKFLGVILDRKLRFNVHKAHILARLKTQQFALTCIAAKTWGPALLRSLAVYKTVVRSVITYAASVFTTPKATQGRGTGFHAPIAKVQNACLRAVAGAYGSTPIRALEELTNCEPINLVLARQAAQFEERAMAPEGKWGEAWRGAERMIERARGRRRRVRVDNLSNDMGQFRPWLSGRSAREATKATWAELREREGRSAGMIGDAWTWAHSKRVYEAMTKAQSSLLTQLRTGHIGLRGHLFRCNVPDVNTPTCECGTGTETARHVLLDCPNADRDGLPPMATIGDLRTALAGKETCLATVKWLMASGRVPMFDRAAQESLGNPSNT